MSRPATAVSPAGLTNRTRQWQDIEDKLPGLEDRHPVSTADIRTAVLDYPELARDVAIARRDHPASRMTAYLESIYSRYHRALFRAPRSGREDLRGFFRQDLPDIVHALRWQIFCVGAGFILAALAGWVLVSSYPDTASLFASPEMIRKVESGALWTEGILNVMPSSLLSVSIFSNNIVVALTTLALGVFYGLGTLYIVGLNGMMLGCIMAFTHQYGLAGELLEFIMAHGPVELSAIVIAGAVGFSIGESLARPGHLSRSQAFHAASTRGAKLMAVCCLFLVGAGIIEGYISPVPDYSMTLRVLVGFGYLLLFVVVLTGGRVPGRGPRRGAADAARGSLKTPGTAAPPAG